MHFKICVEPSAEYPSCLQATLASWSSQFKLHIVPHIPLKHTSTLPLIAERALLGIMRIPPSMHGPMTISTMNTMIHSQKILPQYWGIFDAFNLSPILRII